MYLGKKISVAMATFNGEKYIEEQLLSICTNTVKPDEIVISDDGSTDNTVTIARKIACSDEASGIQFAILTDNQQHGVMVNFAHALINTSGDFIFLCDQDDIWLPDKVKEITESFSSERSAGMIFHNADIIDDQGKKLNKQLVEEGEYGIERINKIPKDLLENVIAKTLINGMCMCLSRTLLNQCFPFPKGSGLGFHDHWISFVSVANDNCYYLNKMLTLYRVHENNTCGDAIYKGHIRARIKKKINRFLSLPNVSLLENYYMGKAMVDYLQEKGIADDASIEVAKRVSEIGSVLYYAEKQSRIKGAWTLCKLYQNDIRYRRSGSKQFVYNLFHILFSSKKQRIAKLRTE